MNAVIILVSSERKPLGVCFPKVRNTQNITETITEAQTVKVEVFFSLKIFSVFDWMWIIVAVAGELRNTVEPSHNMRQIPFQV